MKPNENHVTFGFFMLSVTALCIIHLIGKHEAETTDIIITLSVTVATNAPPRFEVDTKVVEVLENEPLGTPVVIAQAQSGSALYYDISLGNDEGCFVIDQSSGVSLHIAT